METWLDAGWSLRAIAGPFPEELRSRRVAATVPGCVSTDLMAAGIVPDPYIGDSERLHAWVGRTDWRYEMTFEAGPGPGEERVDLVCKGLDTVAAVSLNGALLGATANMHRSYRFDTRGALVPGTNQLVVDFRAPVDAAEERSAQLGPRPSNSPYPFNAIRKMACNYGWDWGPALPTAGIWRPIGLHRWRQARIASVRPLVQVQLPERMATAAGTDTPWADRSSPREADAVVDVQVDLERASGPGRALRVTASVAGEVVRADIVPGQLAASLRVAVGGARLWWPAGYGPQPLYDLEVTLQDAGRPGPSGTGPAAVGAVLDQWRGRVGFRSVELDTRAGEGGARLGFVVNGRAVQVRGANWIPDDCFVSRVGPARYRQRLRQARAANVNLLRVWGGGIYESEDFYAAADELGLLVWQDFMLACAAYSEQEPLRAEIEAEAREAVARLSPHPSLAVWSGGNENIWGHVDWGWEEALDGKSWGAGYYFDIFPAIVKRLDPTRPYMAGSPWSLGYDAHPNHPRYGSMHVWDVWNEKDYLSYREHQPQFVAEFGFQGPPTWPTLARAVTERPLTTSSRELAAHEK
ncbi:MAG: glycoside hydrolase family 2 protein, partial [Acidimicrobiales bacterium]